MNSNNVSSTKSHKNFINCFTHFYHLFRPYGVDKSSTNLPGWGEGGAVTSDGWQITLCDPIDKWRSVVLM